MRIPSAARRAEKVRVWPRPSAGKVVGRWEPPMAAAGADPECTSQEGLSRTGPQQSGSLRPPRWDKPSVHRAWGRRRPAVGHWVSESAAGPAQPPMPRAGCARCNVGAAQNPARAPSCPSGRPPLKRREMTSVGRDVDKLEACARSAGCEMVQPLWGAARSGVPQNVQRRIIVGPSYFTAGPRPQTFKSGVSKR